MGLVAVLGEEVRVAGFGLAGAVVLRAEDPDAVLRQWRRLPDGISVVLLTRLASQALVDGGIDTASVLTAVIPR